jgi:hypothetical protein
MPSQGRLVAASTAAAEKLGNSRMTPGMTSERAATPKESRHRTSPAQSKRRRNVLCMPRQVVGKRWSGDERVPRDITAFAKLPPADLLPAEVKVAASRSCRDGLYMSIPIGFPNEIRNPACMDEVGLDQESPLRRECYVAIRRKFAQRTRVATRGVANFGFLRASHCRGEPT